MVRKSVSKRGRPPTLLEACEYGGLGVSGPDLLEAASIVLNKLLSMSYLASVLRAKAEIERAAIEAVKDNQEEVQADGATPG